METLLLGLVVLSFVSVGAYIFWPNISFALGAYQLRRKMIAESKREIQSILQDCERLTNLAMRLDEPEFIKDITRSSNLAQDKYERVLRTFWDAKELLAKARKTTKHTRWRSLESWRQAKAVCLLAQGEINTLEVAIENFLSVSQGPN